MEQPNVLLICTDHWPGSFLGAAGHPTIRTPTLDHLASNGTRFPKTYTDCPVCIPARRSLMTGLTPRSHGDRSYSEQLAMPKVPSLAQAFRDAGYQSYAVGKLHVYPQRDRIGFDDVILDEEGRCQFGVVDDYELFLGDKGFAGQQFDHGMPTDGYSVRPWHLPEETHPTNWATQQMARVIKRRDPGKPAFWYLSYRHPHPPLVPLSHYLDLYGKDEIDAAVTGAWIDDPAAVPYYLRAKLAYQRGIDQRASLEARRAFYALCTQIDHQLRIVLGTLREESLMDRTIVCFIADHGDMLGNHGLWGKLVHYENSANIPMVLMSYRGDPRVAVGGTDDRLVGLRDVMPSLLELAGISPPGGMDGLSMIGAERRDCIYSEMGEGDNASRMLHDGRHKLIYYPAGNCRQLFDLQSDPQELNNLALRPEHGALLEDLSGKLIDELYGGDLAWVAGGKLVGLPERELGLGERRQWFSQRGTHWPPPSGFSYGEGDTVLDF